MEKLTLIIVIASLILTALNLGYFVYLFTQFKSLQKKQARFKSAARYLYRHAASQAEELIKKVIRKSDKLNQQLSQDLEDELTKLTRAQAAKLELESDHLDKLYQQLISNLEVQVSESIVRETEDNLESFKKNLQEVTLGKEEQIEELVAQDFKQIKKELVEYKADQLKQINSKVSEKVSEIAQKVLGQTISLTEHQRLIDEAIEKAVEEKLFS